MTRTSLLQLRPDKEQSSRLQATLERFNAACNYLAGELYSRRSANKVDARVVFYAAVRLKFGLSSHLAYLTIQRTCEAYAQDKTTRPKFARHDPITYDAKALRFKGVGLVSVPGLGGRIVVPFTAEPPAPAWLGVTKGQADLLWSRDGAWTLAVSATVPNNIEESAPAIDPVVAAKADGEPVEATPRRKLRRRARKSIGVTRYLDYIVARAVAEIVRQAGLGDVRNRPSTYGLAGLGVSYADEVWVPEGASHRSRSAPQRRQRLSVELN